MNIIIFGMKFWKCVYICVGVPHIKQLQLQLQPNSSHMLVLLRLFSDGFHQKKKHTSHKRIWKTHIIMKNIKGKGKWIKKREEIQPKSFTTKEKRTWQRQYNKFHNKLCGLTLCSMELFFFFFLLSLFHFHFHSLENHKCEHILPFMEH